MQLLDLVSIRKISKFRQEVVEIGEAIRFDIVQQTPQFFSVILDGSTCKEQNSLASQSLKCGQDLGIGVLESMSFINDNELEGNLIKHVVLILQKDFIGGDQNLELVKLSGLEQTSLS